MQVKPRNRRAVLCPPRGSACPWAPIDAATGLGTNTKPAFIGDSAGQTMRLVPSNCEGYFLPVDDASKVYVKVGVNGEKVNYRIFA